MIFRPKCQSSYMNRTGATIKYHQFFILAGLLFQKAFLTLSLCFKEREKVLLKKRFISFLPVLHEVNRWELNLRRLKKRKRRRSCMISEWEGSSDKCLDLNQRLRRRSGESALHNGERPPSGLFILVILYHRWTSARSLSQSSHGFVLMLTLE